MPIYEYRCRGCDERTEAMQPMGSGPPGPCPKCGGELRRTWGRVGIRLSGWGFASTDSLLPPDRRGRDFREVRERADRLVEES